MKSMEQLLDIMAYKREVLGQFLLVASILGAFAINGVIGLVTSAARGRLQAVVFGLLSFASLAFVFAAALDA